MKCSLSRAINDIEEIYCDIDTLFFSGKYRDIDTDTFLPILDVSDHLSLYHGTGL